MALDKNWIDLASNSIIAPAVSYYNNHGSKEEKLMTYYYRGRISMNASSYYLTDLKQKSIWALLINGIK